MSRYVGTLVFPKVTGAPSAPTSGQAYYDTTANKLYVYNGTAWESAGTPADATASAKGIVQLAGDLTGTAAAPTIANNAITDAKVATNAAIAFSKLASPTASFSFNSQLLTNVANPTNAQDAATKAYIDNTLAGQVVAVAATANISVAAPPASIDGFSPTNGSRVILAGQTTTSENGVYTYNGAGVAMTKLTIPTGVLMYVASGSVEGGSYWYSASTPRKWMDLTVGGLWITNLANPVNSTDAASKGYVDTAVAGATVADATTTSKGIIQLSGDLAGTAAAPVIGNNVINNVKIAINASIARTKLSSIGIDAVTTQQADVGSVTNPSFTFLGDSDTGFFSPAAGQIGVSLNGTSLLTLSAASMQLATGKALEIGDQGTINFSALGPVLKWDGGTTIGVYESDEISYGDIKVGTVTADGGGFISGAALDMGSQKITSLADPTAPQDAATKAYVDAVKSGLDIKLSVRAMSESNIPIATGGVSLTLDGVAIANGDRVLLVGQTTPAENGIYVASGVGTNVALTRASDADSNAEVTPGLFVFVEQGGSRGDSGWVLTTDAPITLGTTPLAFTQFSGAGQIVAGNGLAKNGNTLDVNVDSSTIEISTDILRVKDLGITNAKIANSTISLTTKVTGSLPIANGGTGQTTAAGIKTSLGYTTRYNATVGDGTATSFVITHNLNTRYAQVQVQSNASPYDIVFPDIEMTTVNTCTIKFAAAPAVNQFDVIVVG